MVVFSIIMSQFKSCLVCNVSFRVGEVTELVPVPDFKSVVSWLRSGKVSSILMLSRHIFKYLTHIFSYSGHTAISIIRHIYRNVQTIRKCTHNAYS